MVCEFRNKEWYTAQYHIDTFLFTSRLCEIGEAKAFFLNPVDNQLHKTYTICRHWGLHCDLELWYTEMVKFVIELVSVAGIGYREHGEEWLEQQSQFENLLTELASSHDAAVPDKTTESLELRSQQSRARVQWVQLTFKWELGMCKHQNFEACTLP